MAPAVAASLVSLLSLRYASAFPFYADMIPNGNFVRRNGVNYPGVGHFNPSGGGPRNPFGLAFAAAGHAWTRELCEQDSDGDGQSNGLELGDPDCSWQPGGAPRRTSDISHPGFKDSTTGATDTPETTPLPPTTPTTPTSSEAPLPSSSRAPAPTSTASPSPPPPAVHFGGAVLLRAHDGSYVGNSGGYVEATWAATDAGVSFEIERARGMAGGDEVRSGDRVMFRATTGKRLTLQEGGRTTVPEVDPDTVHAFWDHKGTWQTFVLQKRNGEQGVILSGDEITLLGHTGKYVAANPGGSITATHDSPGDLETFTIELVGGGAGAFALGAPQDASLPEGGNRRLRRTLGEATRRPLVEELAAPSPR